MNIKRYVADTVQEALQMVKKEMGPDAVILETKTFPRPKGTEQGRKVEVTAAVEYAPEPEPSSEKIVLGLRAVIERYRHLEEEFREMKELLLSSEAGRWLDADVRRNPLLRSRYTNLRRFGLRPELIGRLMDGGEKGGEKGPDTAVGILQDSLSRVLDRVPIGRSPEEEKGRRIIAFVGPTGVGKTTTLAKLAALGAIRQGRKAALITTDTFRVAAASQLETYARIMGIPMETVRGRPELLKAVDRHKDSDFILIDTAGSSPNREEALQEQRKTLDIPGVHSHLVLSATTRYQDLLHIDRQFGALSFRSYIFTKLDEAEDASSMINFLISREKPVSYFSTGQQVPDDLEKATKKKLASLLLARMRRGAMKTREDEVSFYGSGESTEGRSSGAQCRHGESGAGK
jgi:flagellar biosynthesis protein FlhF